MPAEQEQQFLLNRSDALIAALREHAGNPVLLTQGEIGEGFKDNTRLRLAQDHDGREHGFLTIKSPKKMAPEGITNRDEFEFELKLDTPDAMQHFKDTMQVVCPSQLQKDRYSFQQDVGPERQRQWDVDFFRVPDQYHEKWNRDPNKKGFINYAYADVELTSINDAVKSVDCFPEFLRKHVTLQNSQPINVKSERQFHPDNLQRALAAERRCEASSQER